MTSTPKARRDRRTDYYGDWRARVQAMVRSARTRARAAGLPFTLTAEGVLERLVAQGYCCARTGLPLCVDDLDPEQLKLDRSINPWGPSLDRINSKGGYTPKNVQIVCWMYNACKQVSNDHDVTLFAHSLLTHQRARPARGSAAKSQALQP